MCQALLSERDLLESRPAVARERLATLLDPSDPHTVGDVTTLLLLAWVYADLDELDSAAALAEQSSHSETPGAAPRARRRVAHLRLDSLSDGLLAGGRCRAGGSGRALSCDALSLCGSQDTLGLRPARGREGVQLTAGARTLHGGAGKSRDWLGKDSIASMSSVNWKV